ELVLWDLEVHLLVEPVNREHARQRGVILRDDVVVLPQVALADALDGLLRFDRRNDERREDEERGQQTGARQQPETHGDTSKGPVQIGRTGFILTCGQGEVSVRIEKFTGRWRYNRNHTRHRRAEPLRGASRCGARRTTALDMERRRT